MSSWLQPTNATVPLYITKFVPFLVPHASSRCSELLFDTFCRLSPSTLRLFKIILMLLVCRVQTFGWLQRSGWTLNASWSLAVGCRKPLFSLLFSTTHIVSHKLTDQCTDSSVWLSSPSVRPRRKAYNWWIWLSAGFTARTTTYFDRANWNAVVTTHHLAEGPQRLGFRFQKNAVCSITHDMYPTPGVSPLC